MVVASWDRLKSGSIKNLDFLGCVDSHCVIILLFVWVIYRVCRPNVLDPDLVIASWKVLEMNIPKTKPITVVLFTKSWVGRFIWIWLNLSHKQACHDFIWFASIGVNPWVISFGCNVNRLVICCGERKVTSCTVVILTVVMRDLVAWLMELNHPVQEGSMKSVNIDEKSTVVRILIRNLSFEGICPPVV